MVRMGKKQSITIVGPPWFSVPDALDMADALVLDLVSSLEELDSLLLPQSETTPESISYQ